MKKILSLIILLLVAISLMACTSPTPPGTSWADKEILVYDVVDTDADNTTIGTFTTTLERAPENKIIDGNEYEKATSRLTMEYTSNSTEETMTVSSLLKDFSPLATYKEVNAEDKDYTLSSYYHDKYYYYTLNQNGDEETGKMKINQDFIDNDLLYTYLRCQNINEDINKTLSIPDAISGNLQEFSVTKTGTKEIEIPYDDEPKTGECYEIKITRTTSPIGKSIYVYFSPATEDYIVSGGLNSINDSQKMPVKIIENNLTYNLKSITVN